MSNYYNRQWRLPNEENKSKVSNYSMDFDGSSRIDCGNDIQIFTESHSYSFWVKKPTISEGYIFGYGIDSVIIFYSDGRIRFYTGGLTSGTDFYSSTSLSTNTWYHICCTYEKNGDKKIYIDGSLDNTISTTGTIQTGGVGLTIAARNLGGIISHYFTGQLDGMCLFNYTLSSSQVTTLYGSSSTGIGNPMSLSPKPVAYYPLGDQDSFNGAEYLTPNSSLKDYVFGFNGINDYIDFGNLSVFEPTSNYTFSIWFNSGSYVYKTLFGDTSNAFAQGILALLRSSSALDYYHNTTSTYKTLTLSLTDFPVNTWHNLTITWSASTGILRGFIDGKFNAQLTGVNDVEWGNISLELGRYYNTFYYDSKLSNFVMWDATLTDGFSGTPTAGDVAGGQVAEVYNNGTPQTTITGTPIGWWKLDASATFDGSNWSIPDSSSNSNNGTMYGSVATLPAALQQSDLSFTSGYSPYALDFDGTDDYINCGNDSSLVPSSLTISLWFKTSGSASAIPRLLNKSYGGSPYDSYFIRINNGVLNFKIGVSSASVQIAGTTNVVDGNWHNVIGTYDGSQLKLYLDGNSEATPVSETRAIIENTSYNLTLGCELGAYGFSWAFTGSMSNASLWNTALTSAQVTEIYNEGVPSNLNNHSAYSNLVSWWQLGSNSSFNTNWTVLDEKGSNNGTSTNMGEDAIVDGVNTYGGGTSSGMGGDEVIGDAPYSTANALSVNMDVEDRVTDTPS